MNRGQPTQTAWTDSLRLFQSIEERKLRVDLRVLEKYVLVMQLAQAPGRIGQRAAALGLAGVEAIGRKVPLADGGRRLGDDADAAEDGTADEDDAVTLIARVLVRLAARAGPKKGA